MDKTRLFDIASLFNIEGTPINASLLGNGLINDTFLIECSKEDGSYSGRYVLQRINTSVFKNPELLQHNLEKITSHIRKCLIDNNTSDIDRKVLTCVAAKAGGTCAESEGSSWRMTEFIDDSCTISYMTPALARTTGKAFGNFHAYFARPDAPHLDETIPDFHNVPFRIRQLKEAIDNDPAGRLKDVADIADYLLSREREMTLAERLYEAGELPKRISHCDTKVDNILFDTMGRVLCVIDLDTTMPGFIMSDFGDFIRTAGNKGKEDDPNPDNVEVDMEIFREFAAGYLSEATFLTPSEIKTLAHGARRLTYMQTVRFLTDYINGDIYYKISYTEHNLVRTNAQLKLLRSIDSHFEEMEGYIESLVS